MNALHGEGVLVKAMGEDTTLDADLTGWTLSSSQDQVVLHFADGSYVVLSPKAVCSIFGGIVDIALGEQK